MTGREGRGETPRATVVLTAPAGAPTGAETKQVVVDGPIPYASADEIYSSVALAGTEAASQLEAAGYVQEEFFLTGSADVYAHGDDGPVPATRGIPYTTRLLVVRPRDAERFNGVVHMTGIHPNYGTVQWPWIAHHVLTTGAAYVAVGTGTDALSRGQSTADAPVAAPWVTKWFDSARYAPLDWPADDGIAWTVIADGARLLRSADRPVLAGWDIRHVYMSGWSYLGSIQRTYINEGFHDHFRRADGGPLIDGYAIGISSRWQGGGYLPIGASESRPAIADPRRAPRAIDVPVIEFMSQNEAQQNRGPARPDVDEGPGRHRTYEVAGTSHRDTGLTWPRSSTEQLRVRRHPRLRIVQSCERFEDSDVPVYLLFSAAMENLHRWAAEGIPAPPSALLHIDAAQSVGTDDAGNAVGGLRSVELDLPLARYGIPAERQCADHEKPFLLMHRIPFAADELARRYPGGEAEYRERAREVIEQMRARRHLRDQDAEVYLARIDERASAAFAPAAG